MTDRELMQMALDALMTCQEDWIFDGEDEYPVDTYDEKMVSAAFKALRARLAQPEPEPVAWVAYENGEKHGIDFDEEEIAELPVGTMLYTAPPQREWQGLTDEEYTTIMQQADHDAAKTGSVFQNLRYAIEAKLKEKNT